MLVPRCLKEKVTAMILSFRYALTAINDSQLLTRNVLSTVLCVVLVTFGVITCYEAYQTKFNANRKRIRIFKNSAINGDGVERMMDDAKSDFKKKRSEKLVEKIVVGALIAVLLVLDLSFSCIPGWIDYAKKDYVEYVGEFECESKSGSKFTYLPDGTKLSGTAGLESGEYYGRIVYGKRSGVTVGSEVDGAE